jgi:uncharacterized protein YndB with AHSA1/START domain
MTDLVIERLFDAPRDVVYQAFIDPDQLAQWFGPVGFTCPRDSIKVDARPGGRRLMTMVKDGEQAGSPIETVFDELVENELIVSHEDFDDEMAALFGSKRMTVRIEFIDRGEQTLLRLTQGPYSAQFEPMARAGWQSSFTKLDNVFLARLGLLELHNDEAGVAQAQ